MGYDAFVKCNCYKEGKTTKPPFEEYTSFDFEFGIDINPPDEIYKNDEKKYYEILSDFDNWKDTACEHENMDYLSLRVGNISAMSAFRNMIKQLNTNDRLPILSNQLPTSNDGHLPVELAPQLLAELKLISGKIDIISLFEVASKEEIASVDTTTQWCFQFYKNYIAGIDCFGFFILEKVEEHYCAVFKSHDFSIQKIDAEQFRYTDIERQIHFDCPINLFKQEENKKNILYFKTRIETIDVFSRFQYMIETLQALGEASMLTGNPIVWC